MASASRAGLGSSLVAPSTCSLARSFPRCIGWRKPIGHVEVETLAEQPAREILPSHQTGRAAARRRKGAVEPDCRRDGAGPRGVSHVPFLHRLSAIWRNVIRRRRVEEDLDEEVHAYIDLVADENRSRGMAPDTGASRRDARVRRRRSGQGAREARASGEPGSSRFVRDFGYGLRIIRRNPGFTAGAILTLALGIGATTAVFTIVDETLFRTVPYAHADRLATVIGAVSPGGGGGSNLTPQAVLGWQQAGLFEAFEGYGCLAMDAGGDDDRERLTGCDVSTGLFSMLGVVPADGRGFSDADGRPGR